MTRVVDLSDAIARRRRVLKRRGFVSIPWLAHLETLIKCRARSKEVI